MKCSVCGSNSNVAYSETYDDRYGYPGIFQITQCIFCGHKSLPDHFTHDEIINLYTNYYPRSTFDLGNYYPRRGAHGFLAWLNGENSFAFRWVPKNVRVLDIGCGFGETLGYHTSRGCDVYGVDADENIRRVANKFGYKVHVGLFDSNLYTPDFFDYVTMDQVLEHMSDPLETLRGIARVLKPGGVLIVGTPNANGWGAKFFGRRWINWHAPYHLQFFSENSMKLVAEKVGLVLEKTRTITNSGWLLLQWLHLLTYPHMGEPSKFWSHLAKRSFKEKVLFELLTIIHLTKVNHIITRIFDGLGMGDNYLFLLRKK